MFRSYALAQPLEDFRIEDVLLAYETASYEVRGNRLVTGQSIGELPYDSSYRGHSIDESLEVRTF